MIKFSQQFIFSLVDGVTSSLPASFTILAVELEMCSGGINSGGILRSIFLKLVLCFSLIPLKLISGIILSKYTNYH